MFSLENILVGECQECYTKNKNQYMVCHTPIETHSDNYAVAIEKDSIWCCSQCSEIAEEFIENRKPCKCGSTDFSLVKLPF